jgi:hypothetical protein
MPFSPSQLGPPRPTRRLSRQSDSPTARNIVAEHLLVGERLADNPELHTLYQDYLLQRVDSHEGNGEQMDVDKLATAFQGVWFVDGGTLDNKPFSFVIEQLPLRHAESFVDRKLLYIEPSPEDPESTTALENRPKIVGNALAGLSSLPRYESIIEDLTRCSIVTAWLKGLAGSCLVRKRT